MVVLSTKLGAAVGKRLRRRYGVLPRTFEFLCRLVLGGMKLKTILKKIAKRMGFEVRRMTPSTSDALRTRLLLNHHKIDLVLDVGANAGQYASSLREFGYAGKIVSFEPLSSAYSVLERKSRTDPLWIVASRTAIGNIDGKIEINISENSYSSSVLGMLDSHLDAAPNSAYIGSEMVAINKLDTLANDYIKDDDRSIYLKMDVQGFEMQVLEGAAQILPRVMGIQTELSLVPLYKGQALFTEMLEKMDELGYELHAIYPGFSDMKTGRMLQSDGLFFRKEKF